MPLLIKYHLKEIEGKGIGLFTSEPIKKNTIIYKDDPLLERIYTDEEVKKANKYTQNFIYKYACFSDEDQKWYLAVDNERFINHSDDPNTLYVRKLGKTMTIKNIKQDEELTIDYRSCCDKCKIGEFGFEIK